MPRAKLPAAIAVIPISLVLVSYISESHAAEGARMSGRAPAVEDARVSGPAFHAGGAGSGGMAPAFELPAVDGSGTVSSRDLFSSNEHTFLLFWESGCPHCVEALSEAAIFDGNSGGAGVGLAGINCGDAEPFEIRAVVEESGAKFPQLLDRGRAVAARYIVPISVFTIVLVDGGGMMVARAEDPQGDISLVMEEMLIGDERYRLDEQVSREPGESVGAPPRAAGGMDVRGEARIRFLSISARGDGASGPYGEPVNSGNRMTGRLELELSRKAGRFITAGGLLRASNEGLDALRGGPDYFDSEYGSVFAAVEAGRFHARLGYYSISMTPLTLMRWDWDDNPRSGGYAGCGCGTAAGVLLAESLEQLGPDMRFEGGVASFDLGGLYARAFYAMPRRARAIRRVETEFGGEEAAAYSLETAGLETKWRMHMPRFGRALMAGAHMVVSWENPRSIDPAALEYNFPFEWYRATVLSLTGEIPVARHAALRGEYAVLNRTEFHNPPPDYEGSFDRNGNGGYVGVAIDHGSAFIAACDYVEIGRGFHSPFAAMSYQSGTTGIRISSRLSYPDERSALSIFYKRLRETGPEGPGLEKRDWSVLGASIDVDFENGLGGGLAYIDEGSWRDGDAARFDAARKSLTAGARFRFNRASYIQGQYQRIDNSDDSSGSMLESETEMFSVYIGAIF